ncbi:glycosyltransferase [Haloarcula marismortui]|jgi:glycosyltransferase involved in cell wall biosynthesis|uniref:Glycosyltransferase n=2 Tax=Haloarcula marismortui ATCC 33800 TaxID=662476 RepID=A0A8T8KEL7_9EURY|nr:glycosyltransferase [Haloarcula sinaiiensis]QUJ73570.1 glycosyltransferase [Haloarcula sinaiiensis ATCC 33800]
MSGVDTAQRTTVLFTTSMNLSGTSGGNIATRELIAAIGNLSHVDLLLICPRPLTQLPDRISAVISDVWFLPQKESGSISWHAKAQLPMLKNLLQAFISYDVDVVTSRVGPTTIFPPVVTTLSNTEYDILVRGMVSRNLKFKRVIDLILRLNAVRSDEAYVAYNEIKSIIDSYRLPSQSPSIIVPNGVNPDKFQPVDKDAARSQLDIEFDPDEFVIGFVGSIKQRHSLRPLIESLQSLPDDPSLTALIVGSGPLVDELVRLTEKLDIRDRVTFTGFVPHESVNTYISACDVLYGVVSPENPSNPIKCYEYLSCERPIITTDVPEFEFVGQHDLGAFVESPTPDAIASCITDFMQMDEKDIEKMGTRGREYVVDNHTWEIAAKRIITTD